MQKYLLNSEKIYIKILIDIINKYLYYPIPPITEEKIKNIVIENKDKDIEDYLNTLTDQLIQEISPILKNNTTPGLQLEIKNPHFQIEAHGGYYISNNNIKSINSETKFSLDSISKVLTSIITMQFIKDNNLNLNTTINEINNNYKLDSSIKSILNFTSCIKTDKRIDNLSKEETIKLLKECKENLKEKELYDNYFEYSDIGYMILRQVIPSFLQELDKLLKGTNITYNNENKDNITGGKRNEENITPDPKGRDIIFPGHTGLYSNITNIIDFIYTFLNTEKILTKKEKELLWTQAYNNPYSYNKITHKRKYINKIAGIYKIPNNITPIYDKLKSFDMPNNTTKNSMSSTGTCGSWIINDTLYNNYTAGLLTNPYTFVNNTVYPEEINTLENTYLQVSKNGKIIDYSKHLNEYKKIIVNYSIILDILSEFFKKNDQNFKTKTLKKEIILP